MNSKFGHEETKKEKETKKKMTPEEKKVAKEAKKVEKEKQKETAKEEKAEKKEAAKKEKEALKDMDKDERKEYKKEKKLEKCKIRKPGKLLKALARGNLHGNYGPLMGATVIVIVLPILVMFPFNKIFDIQISNLLTVILSGESIEWAKVIIYYIIQLVVSVFASVLGIGVYKMHLDLVRGKRVEFMNLLYGFSSNTLQCILLSVLMMLISNVFTWPGMICQAVATLFDGQIKLVWNIVGLVLLVVGGIALIVISLAVAMAYFVFLESEDAKAFASLKTSFTLMKKQKARYLGLLLSFIGWGLLGICSAGIGFLWIAPYVQQTKALFYLDVKGELAKVLEKRAELEGVR